MAGIRQSLTRRGRLELGGLAAAIVALHVIGFGTLLLVVLPRHFSLGHGGVFGAGLGITAYTLGLRHAFDADHIAAIDNSTRKLMSDGKRPHSVGFFFSLGHSTVVFMLALALSLGARTLGSEVTDNGSMLHELGGLIGTSVSGVFLYAIAAVNLVTLLAIVRVSRRMRTGEYDEAALEHQLNSRGLMNRVLGRRTRTITAPWQMYPVGVLFGLGFDTATEIALLFLAAGAATRGLPVYAILCLPVLFAAGMSLLDTVDGWFMRHAYGWALAKPARKLYYNLTITGLSVFVAVFIGTIEILGLIGGEYGLSGGFWDFMGNFDINTAGFVIVGVFIVTWIAALAYWHFGKVEQRWDTRQAVTVTAADGADS